MCPGRGQCREVVQRRASWLCERYHWNCGEARVREGKDGRPGYGGGPSR